MDKYKLSNHNWLITIIAIIIQIIGIFVIFSTTYTPEINSNISQETIKQIIFLIIGLIIYFSISFIDISWLRNRGIILTIYFIMLGLLIYVRFFGEEVANTNRWLRLGIFSIQPAEYAKLVIILLTSYIFSEKKPIIFHRILPFFEILISRLPYINRLNINKQAILVIDSFLMILPIVLLIFIQPALGNSIISFTIWLLTVYTISSNHNQIDKLLILIFFNLFLLLQIFYLNLNTTDDKFYISFGIKDIADISYTGIFIILLLFIFIYRLLKPKFIWLITIPLILITIGYLLPTIWNHSLEGYQRKRIITFVLGPEYDTTGNGYQVIQSRTAVGAGMLFGRGFFTGSQSNLNILTEAHNDFIFASYAEQFGYLGSLILFLLYALLIFQIAKTAQYASNSFSSNICIAVSILLLIHIFINIGMNMGKLPVTGIPLPLMSSGGSSILMIMIALSFVQSTNTSKRPIDFVDKLMLTSAS